MSAYQAYRGNQINTAGPLGLILLSYDALYQSLGRAVHAIHGGDLAAEADHSARALEALIELSSSLNMEDGGEISQDLSALYTYMMQRIADGMCTCSTDAAEEVMALVLTLREGWAGLAETQTQSRASAYEPSAPSVGSSYSAAAAYG